MAEVTMSLEEYNRLLAQIEGADPVTEMLFRSRTGMPLEEPPKKKRKTSKYQREFGRQLKQLSSQKRLKDGSYRAGWNRSKVLSKAHKLTRKSLGMK